MTDRTRVAGRQPTAAQLRLVVSRRIDAAGKSQRGIEQELGWSEGRLEDLLQGRSEVTLRQVEELASVVRASPLELLADLYLELAPEPSPDLPDGLLTTVSEQVAALEQIAEVFLQAQSLFELPAQEDVAAMRRGDKPMTRTAYLLARLQSASVQVENVASDLKTDLEYGFEPIEMDLVPAFFNALEAVIERLSAPASAGNDQEA